MVGYYGFNNTGDEAILSSMLADMRALRKDLNFVIVSGSPVETEKKYQVQAIHWQDVERISQEIRLSDMVIIGGGGLFQDYWGAQTDSLLTPKHAGVSFYSGIAFLATFYRKPLMLYAVGVGPLLSSEGRELTRLAFSLAKIITVRDVESRNLLSSLGVPETKILVTGDPALTFTPAKEQAKNKLRELGVDTDAEKVVGISLRNWDWGIGQEDWYKKIAKVLDRFIAKYHVKLLFIPFQINEDKMENDYLLSQRVLDAMDTKENVLLLSEAHEAELIAGFIACTDLMLGMRLHSLIFAAKEEVPVVGLAYDAKVANFLRSINLYEYSVAMHNIQTGNLFHILEEAWEKKVQIKALLLEEVVRRSKERTDDDIQLVLSLLEKSLKENGSDVENIDRIRSIVLPGVNAIANKEQTIAEKNKEIQGLQEELHTIFTSKVWLVAKILQKIVIFLMPLNSKRRKIVEIFFRVAIRFANFLHEKLPLAIQRKTVPIVSKFIAVISLPKKTGMPEDIAWEEFRDKVLTHRYDYKGIFVQKAVIDWSVPLYQRPQHMASALGKLGYLVIYQTDNSTNDNVDGFRYIGKNIWLTNSRLVDTIEETVHSVYSTAYGTGYLLMKEFDNPSSWVNKRNIFVYEYIDHIDPKITASDNDVKILRKMRDFVFSGASDFIIASAADLVKEAIDAVGKDKVLSIPNGVDVEHYRNFDDQAVQLPANYLKFREKYSKIVGYFGALAPWLWYGELNKLAQERTDLGFVFIGPDYLYGSTKLAKLKNLLYLGSVDYSILPAYARLFDICFIPFEPGEIAQTTSPLKLFEYFALEKPVVTTSFMKECVAFNEVFHGSTFETLSKAIDNAFLVKDDTVYKAKLAQLADQNSWLERAKKMESVFEKLKRKNDY